MNSLAQHEYRSDTHLADRVADLERQLANEKARDIHSCHNDCTRNGCVNRRLREQNAELQKDSARYNWLISQEAWEPPREALPKWYGGKIRWIGGTYSINEINVIIDEARK
jgi:hypothetical protein